MAAKVFTEENMVKLRNLDEDSIQAGATAGGCRSPRPVRAGWRAGRG